jgi:hypothetical protein
MSACIFDPGLTGRIAPSLDLCENAVDGILKQWYPSRLPSDSMATVSVLQFFSQAVAACRSAVRPEKFAARSTRSKRYAFG